MNGIKSSISFLKFSGGPWVSLLREFNPLGQMADMYARTLAYKIETQRLDAELKQIESQTAIAHYAIDKTYRLKMEELVQRRISLISFYQTVNAELERLHMERNTVLKMAQVAQLQAFSPNLSFEERQLANLMAIELIRELPRFSEQANQSLQQLVQVLPPVEIPPALLK